MGLDYADKQYGTAVHLLATGTGRIQERLFSAELSFVPLQQDDLPEADMWKRHEAILAAQTKVKHAPHQRGYFQVTLDQMSDDEAHEIADRIFNQWDLIRDRLAGR